MPADRDFDSVVDFDDRCPDVPEDSDGWQDDGCPEPDRDGDQIADNIDACVDTPETLNGIDDDDGCPDQAKLVVIDEGSGVRDSENPGQAKPRTTAGTIHYQVPHPLSVKAGKTTMVPLINAVVKGEEILLYRRDGNVPDSDSHPFRAIRFENNAHLELIPGPVAIYTRAAYSGEGLLGALHPGESAHIPFALDTSTLVEVERQESKEPLGIVARKDGRIVVLVKMDKETNYRARLGLKSPTAVFFEHRQSEGYRLAPGLESTRVGARDHLFKTTVRDRRAALKVSETQEIEREVSIKMLAPESLRRFADAPKTEPALREKLFKLADLMTETNVLAKELATTRQLRCDQKVRVAELRKTLKDLREPSLRRRLVVQLDKALADLEENAEIIAASGKKHAFAQRRLEELWAKIAAR
jgi:hypothetical protein